MMVWCAGVTASSVRCQWFISSCWSLFSCRAFSRSTRRSRSSSSTGGCRTRERHHMRNPTSGLQNAHYAWNTGGTVQRPLVDTSSAGSASLNGVTPRLNVHYVGRSSIHRNWSTCGITDDFPIRRLQLKAFTRRRLKQLLRSSHLGLRFSNPSHESTTTLGQANSLRFTGFWLS